MGFGFWFAHYLEFTWVWCSTSLLAARFTSWFDSFLFWFGFAFDLGLVVALASWLLHCHICELLLALLYWVWCHAYFVVGCLVFSLDSDADFSMLFGDLWWVLLISGFHGCWFRF